MFSNSKPNYSKLRTNLRLAINRLKLMEKKKTELALKARREIADFIRAEKTDRARIRVEHIIREDYLVEAMEIIEMFCDLLLTRFGLIEKMKEMDPGLEEAIASVIWVTPRLSADIQELRQVQDQLTMKYGKEYVMACHTNKLENVNVQVLHKLSTRPPPKRLIEMYMMEIAKSYNIPFEPDPLLIDDGGPPAAPPPNLIDFDMDQRKNPNNNYGGPGNFPGGSSGGGNFPGGSSGDGNFPGGSGHFPGGSSGGGNYPGGNVGGNTKLYSNPVYDNPPAVPARQDSYPSHPPPVGTMPHLNFLPNSNSFPATGAYHAGVALPGASAPPGTSFVSAHGQNQYVDILPDGSPPPQYTSRVDVRDTSPNPTSHSPVLPHNPSHLPFPAADPDPPPIPSRPPAAGGAPPKPARTFNAADPSLLDRLPSYDEALSHHSEDIQLPVPPRTGEDSFGLPSVPSDSITTSGADDINFDDLTRRFENLKKK